MVTTLLLRFAGLSFSLWDSLPDRELLEAARAERVYPRPTTFGESCPPADGRSAHASEAALVFRHQMAANRPPRRTVERLVAVSPSFRPTSFLIYALRWTCFWMRSLQSDGCRFPQSCCRRRLVVRQRPVGRRRWRLNCTAVTMFRFRRLAVNAQRSEPACYRIRCSFPASRTTRRVSPIHRGVFVARSLLGRSLRPVRRKRWRRCRRSCTPT